MADDTKTSDPLAETMTTDSCEPVDLEDGELSDEDNENSTTQDITSKDETEESQTDLTSSNTNTEPAPAVAAPAAVPAASEAAVKPDDPADKSSRRKSSECTDDTATAVKPAAAQADDSSDSSSSSEDEDKSDRKRKKKLEKKRRKEKKREKRKREKQKERDERRKRRKYHDDYDRMDGGYGGGEYNGYYNDHENSIGMASPRQHRQHRSGYDRDYYGSYGRSAAPGPYDSPPGPYDSPPRDESSDDEFSETLYNMVQSELTDPSVSVSDREVLKKPQKRMAGLAGGKFNKMAKKKKWNDSGPPRSARRGPPPRRGHDEPRIKCKYYAEGKCHKGDKCLYSHNFIPAKKMEACKFFLQGYCAKGDMCIYLHSEVPCKYYHTGQQCFNGDKCKFSHDPLTDSTRPLLEKAILLEETGTFKPEKPSLLGSPPRDIITSYANRCGSNTMVTDVQVSSESRSYNPPALDNRGDGGGGGAGSRPIPSIFDLSLRPTAELQQKLNAGLYEEITAPISEGDEEEQFNSPVKMPQSFYSDTLTSPTRSKGQVYPTYGGGITATTAKSLAHGMRRNRWGPDLPNTHIHDARLGSGDAEPVKKGPLLPLPTPPTPFSTAANTLTTHSAPATEANDLSKAAVNLTKIISALRSTSQGAVVTKAADPRLTTTIADPRMKMADPRSQDPPNTSLASDPRLASSDGRLTADPRQAPRTALLPDPKSSEISYPYQDPRQSTPTQAQNSPPPPLSNSLQSTVSPANRPVPEINGIPTRPMDYRVRLVSIESRGIYIPPGADSSQEMLKDPRIRKRIQAMKQGEHHAPPSLPDITADLHRLMSNSQPAAVTDSKPQPASIDPRRSSLNKAPPATGRPNTTNPAKLTLNRIQQTLALHSGGNNNGVDGGFSHASADDDEENNSLTIDLSEETRNGSNNLTASAS